MSFLTYQLFGVKLWLLLYLVFSFLAFISVVIYLKRERLRRFYYKFRFPEKLIKIIMHYQGGLYKVYWRVIPDDNSFIFENKQYQYSDESLIKDNPFLAYKNKAEEYVFKVGEKVFNLDFLKVIKDKQKTFPEIHYFFNNPNPITFSFNKKDLELTAKSLKEFKENDLFSKLLTLEGDTGKLMIMFMLILANSVGIVFIIAKMMGWVD